MNKDSETHNVPRVAEEGGFPDDFASSHEDARSCLTGKHH